MVTEKQKTKKQKDEESFDSLSVIQKNEALLKMYRDNSKLGAANLGGSSPMLKIHATNRSTSNFLEDGVTEPNDGWFFYAPTKEQFKEIEVYILTISRGFRSEGMKKDENKSVFNQLMAGVIVNDQKPRPFIMYVNGKKLQRMWNFGKEASRYTRNPSFPIPLFTIKVKLTTEKEVVEYEPGKKTNVWLLNFEILKDKEGRPTLVSDERTFNYLKNQVLVAEENIQAIIDLKATETQVEDQGIPAKNKVVEAVVEEVPLSLPGEEESINPDEIPF